MDSPSANAAYAEKIGVTLPLLSDMDRKVTAAYGILNNRSVKGVEVALARRATFVVDRNGIIQHIVEGEAAIDPASAVSACTMLKDDKQP
jgi:peroxiredoxin Q/BCP